MLLECYPYGEDFVVKKLECVLHVAKRVFKRANEARKSLIKKKKALKQAEKMKATSEKAAPKKISPKKVVKRKTAIVKKVPALKTQDLTIKLMKELSENYGLAVQRNIDSVEGMRKEIWAGYYHKISTDAKPQHLHCSPDWCKYLKSQAANKVYNHPPALSADVQEVLKPIYEDLTKTDLLERCLGVHTQNNNESFNKCVWDMAPKHMFNGKQIVDIACKISACIYNEGYKPVLKIMEVLGIKLSPIAIEFAKQCNKLRIKDANRRSSQSSKEARTKRKQARLEEIEVQEQAEGEMYGPGIAD